jgi:glutaredoxin
MLGHHRGSRARTAKALGISLQTLWRKLRAYEDKAGGARVRPLAGDSPGPLPQAIRVDLYTKRGCCLCDEAKAVLAAVRRDVPFELREVDIESTPELLATYGERIPFVTIDGRPAFKFRVDEAALRRRLARSA